MLSGLNFSKPGQFIELFESCSGRPKKVHLPHMWSNLLSKDNIKKACICKKKILGAGQKHKYKQ